jgi:hypothetical protein
VARHLVGYDPGRVAELSRRTGETIEHLRAMGSDDPTAADALVGVGLVCFELDTLWLPAVAAVAADQSMAGWVTSPPAPASAGSPDRAWASGANPPCGVESAAAVAAIDTAVQRLRAGDDGALEDLRALLEEHGDEPAVMAAVLDAWGAAGFFDHLAVVAGYGPAGAEVAEQLVAALDHAPDPVAFGHQLGVAAAARLADPSAMPNDAFTLAPAYAVTAFIAGSGHAPPGFAVALATGVTTHASTGGQFGGPHGAPSDLKVEAGPDGVAFLHDPVAAALAVLVADPASAAQFYADADLARYVFVEHEFHDGYTALFTSWAAAAAGPHLRDPTHPPDPAVAHATNVIATTGVAWLAERDGFAPADVSAEAAIAAAEVVTTHLVAVERTVVDPVGVQLAGPDSGVALPTIAHESFAGGPTEVALLDADGLALLVGAAGSDDAGVEIVRAGSAAFHANTSAGLAADLVADIEAGADPASITQRLDAVVARAGHLEGYLLAAMWQVRQAAGRERDQLVAFWVDHAVTVTGFVARRTPLSPFTAAIPLAGQELTGSLTTTEAAMVAAAAEYADEQAGRLTFVFARALAAPGLIAMPGPAPTDGLTYGEFVALPAATRVEFWSALERGEAGHGIALSLTTARDAIKLEQSDLYDAG